MLAEIGMWCEDELLPPFPPSSVGLGYMVIPGTSHDLGRKLLLVIIVPNMRDA